VNASLLAGAAEGHIVLHCLPAYRGKEISDETLEGHAASIFRQAENRLHALKAVLVALARV
jgi:ornithine carbamoyltransferase